MEAKNKVNSVYMGDPAEIAIELERIENTIGTSITIYDQNLRVRYSSFSRILNQKPFERRPPEGQNQSNGMGGFFKHPNRLPNYLGKIENIPEEGLFHIRKDIELKVDFLEYFSKLDTNEIILLRVPLISIFESVNIAKDFSILVGIAIVVLGGIWAYVFSKKFTNPILHLNHIAENMSNLDFSKKCMIEGEDEIGELGKSINHLSEQLDSTICELNDKNARLTIEIEKERKIDEMRKQFISNVSHELKTPIALIQGYAEGLRYNIVEDEENKNFYCEVIIDEAHKMNRLVKDLLNLSQYESGFFQLEKSTFDISSLINQVANKYRGILEKNEINLWVRLEKEILVNADVIRIEQILINYLNNALNHVDEKKEIKIDMVELKDKVRISVFNSGKHIPHEDLDNIWMSFYKVDQARTREYGGYGLGLSIVKAIQGLHHNKFGVSNEEEGVLFWFEVDRIENI